MGHTFGVATAPQCMTRVTTASDRDICLDALSSLREVHAVGFQSLEVWRGSDLPSRFWILESLTARAPNPAVSEFGAFRTVSKRLPDSHPVSIQKFTEKLPIGIETKPLL